MPLSDREQKILAEIERHFHAEDPSLARAVRKIDRSRRNDLRWPLLGVIAGLVAIGATFTSNTLIALVGFAMVVVSATYLIQAIRARAADQDNSGDEEGSSSRIKGRRRFRRA
ncbi:MAG: DUF3040 domain-containing protein [Actinomycetota bacterium]